MEQGILYLVCFFCGWYLREWFATWRMNRLLGRMEGEFKEKMQEHIEENYIKIKIEKNDDGYFAYKLDDSSFMAMGVDRQQLEEKLVARYPGKTFAAEEDNLVEVGFKNESI